jgi:putative FmdB family regulatory protein
MPLYEYECQACHRRLEKIQKFSDPELTLCPHCGGKLERTITAAAFSFAGGGWYKDGYSSAKPEAASAPSDSAKPATTDSAPAAATPAPSASAPAPASTPTTKP